MRERGIGGGADTSFGPIIPWVVILVFFGLGLSGVFAPRDSTAAALATAFVSTPGLNVRDGPGRDHSVLATLSQGDAVHLLGEQRVHDGSIWVRIRAGGGDGWVSLRYLSAATGVSPPAVQGTRPTSSRPRVTLQYQRPADLRMVISVRGVLAGKGWRVTGPEHVLPAGDNRPETYGGVRFFFEADSALARAVCTEVVAELAKQGMTVTMPLWPMVTGQREGRFNASPGLIEVWISPLPPAAQGSMPMGQCGR